MTALSPKHELKHAFLASLYISLSRCLSFKLWQGTTFSVLFIWNKLADRNFQKTVWVEVSRKVLRKLGVLLFWKIDIARRSGNLESLGSDECGFNVDVSPRAGSSSFTWTSANYLTHSHFLGFLCGQIYSKKFAGYPRKLFSLRCVRRFRWLPGRVISDWCKQTRSFYKNFMWKKKKRRFQDRGPRPEPVEAGVASGKRVAFNRVETFLSREQRSFLCWGQVHLKTLLSTPNSEISSYSKSRSVYCDDYYMFTVSYQQKTISIKVIHSSDSNFVQKQPQSRAMVVSQLFQTISFSIFLIYFISAEKGPSARKRSPGMDCSSFGRKTSKSTLRRRPKERHPALPSDQQAVSWISEED